MPLVEMSGELSRRFAAVDFLNDWAGREDFHIVTGFGPTNAPTAGTLSIMCGIVEAQRAFRLPLTVVISDLGAWNCRNVAWADLCEFRNRMRAFLLSLGFDDTVGKIRSHLETENLIRAGRIARYLKLEDFEQYQEEFLALYSSQGLLGSRVGLLVDSLYTVADILQPIEQGSSSLVICGLEEKYFVRLARIILERQGSEVPGLGWRGDIGALYCRVVRGLAGYPKMSKSIEKSSLHVGLSRPDVASRILADADSDQVAILDAIELASDWSDIERTAARTAFANLPASSREWRSIKERYIETFMKFARLWSLTAQK